MLSRTQMRQFLAVVDTGSFTRAANALNIAQPSLSGGIAELERQLGTRLFVRERRRIGLTAAGNALLPLARGIERTFHEAEARIGQLPVPVRPIRLGVLHTVPTAWIAEAAASYSGVQPLELVEGSARELASALASGSLDLALTLVAAGPGAPEAVLEEEYCMALSQHHRLAAAESLLPGDVAGETMIARRACEVLGETSRFFTEHAVRPRFALRSESDDRVMAMVRSGLGVTVAPRSLAIDGVAMIALRGFGRSRRIGFAYADHWAEQFGPDHDLSVTVRQTAPPSRLQILQ